MLSFQTVIIVEPFGIDYGDKTFSILRDDLFPTFSFDLIA